MAHDSIAHLLFDFSKNDDSITYVSWDRQKMATATNINNYMSDYLTRLILPYCSDQVKIALYKEERLFEKLTESLYEYFAQTFDVQGYSGYWQKYYKYASVWSERRHSVLLQLYTTLINENYTYDVYKPITSKRFAKQYSYLANEMKSNRDYYEEHYWSYDKVKAEKSIRNLSLSWNSYMNLRKKISDKFSGKVKHAFDNGTYLMQKQHLIDLLNCYGNYDAISPLNYEKLLRDTCTYEELFNYHSDF